MNKNIKNYVRMVILSTIFLVFFMASNVFANPYSGGDSNCTWTAWQQAYDNTGIALPGWGNAGSWYSSAQAAGYTTSTTPRARSIAVYSGNPGHVAYVADYNSGSGQIYVKEGGYLGGYHEGWTPIQPTYNGALLGFIYLGSVNNPPVGNLDLCTGGMGTVQVAGWAKDNDSPNTQLQVHVYIGGAAGTAGAEGHAIVADGNRSDVGPHAFDVTFDTKKTGSQEVYAYAIDSAGGSNTVIGHTVVNISDPNPVGAFDSVKDMGGSIRVKGWAYDPSDTTKPVTIHVYIGGPAGSSGYDFHSITANTYRSDVNQVYKCGDYHGFDAVIPTTKIGNQPVYVYAINVGSGWVNSDFGQKNVTITGHVHNLEKIPSKEATTSSPGNIEYWKCSSCGKLFKDSAGKTEISISDTVIPQKKSGTGSDQTGGGSNPSGGNNPSGRNKPTDGNKPSSQATETAAGLKEPITIAKVPASVKAKAKKNKVTVSWKKIKKNKSGKKLLKQIKSIQVQYSTDKAFKKDAKIKTVGKKKTKVKLKLQKKTTYYIRVRYKGSNGFSKWSKVKKVKTKK